MNNQEILSSEILKSAIEKAYGKCESIEIDLQRECEITVMQNDDILEIPCNSTELIFSHDFAKAFWGESFTDGKRIMQSNDSSNTGQDWEHHLQIMVLREDPIQYLKQFL